MSQSLPLSSATGPLHREGLDAFSSAQVHPYPVHVARAENFCVEDDKERLADRLQALMDALPAAVLVLDGDGRVVECNPAAESLLGISLQGELWRDLIQRLFIPQASSTDDLLLHNGRFVTLVTQPLGTNPGQVLLLQDVTEKHRLESRLEHHRRLADMGRMAASLAHQIRTPLSAAILYLSQLGAPALDVERRERFTSKALDSLKGLEKLITDMLLFADGGKGHLESVEPTALLQELAEEMHDSLKVRNVTLVHSTPIEKMGLVLANRTLLKSALQNLVVNAGQALDGEHRQGVIELAVYQSGDWVELTVADNGPGIALTEQQRIFEPFVSGRSGGSGLGLAVVRAVANTLGGELALESEPGRGSRFAIRLPVHKSITASAAFR